VGKCRNVVTKEYPAEIECPECGGETCEHCVEGWYTVDECPSRYIGQELISDIQIVSASDHHLPVSGGLLDQSAWWFELRQLLRSEEHRITEQQMKRRE
jgi:hypothetical protein